MYTIYILDTIAPNTSARLVMIERILSIITFQPQRPEQTESGELEGVVEELQCAISGKYQHR